MVGHWFVIVNDVNLGKGLIVVCFGRSSKLGMAQISNRVVLDMLRLTTVYLLLLKVLHQLGFCFRQFLFSLS